MGLNNPSSSGPVTSISNAGGGVSVDGAGAIHITPAADQNTNIAGGALAITASAIIDGDFADSKAVDGHRFYVGSPAVLVGSIGPNGYNGKVGQDTQAAGAFTTLSASADILVNGNGIYFSNYSKGSLQVPQEGEFRFTNAAETAHFKLVAAAANTLAQRNGANPQQLQVFKSYVDDLNKGYFAVSYSGVNCYLGTEGAGSVSQSNLILYGATVSLGSTNGTEQWTKSAAGHLSATGAYNITTTGNLSGSNLQFGLFTVATLPAGAEGQNVGVTDALAPTFLATVVGGGGVHTPVYHNGTTWVVA